MNKYELGAAYGHFAFAVNDMAEFQARLRSTGADFSWGPKASPSGRSTIAFGPVPVPWEHQEDSDNRWVFGERGNVVLPFDNGR